MPFNKRYYEGKEQRYIAEAIRGGHISGDGPFTRPDTLNIDETHLEKLLTARTRAVAPVHYAGVGYEMGASLQLIECFTGIDMRD